MALPARRVVSTPSPGPERATEQADQQPLAVGSSIGAVWQVDTVLGTGGMGSVYRCHNRHSPRVTAAIKLLDPQIAQHPEARERLLREAEILYTVDHPNIVRVSNLDLDADPPFIEMEHIDGVSLEQTLAERGQLPVAEVVAVATQLADALHHMHRRRVYHRDLKPANILIDRDGRPRIVDFGLAVHQSTDASTDGERPSTTFGTIAYCPPEWGSAPIDPVQWDLYALGVVLYEALTGTTAFPTSAADPLERLEQLVRDKRQLQHLDPGPPLHPRLRELVRQLTSRDPSQRLADTRALLAAMRQLDPDEVPPTPIRSLDTGSGRRSSFPPRARADVETGSDNPTWVSFGLLGALGLLLAGALVLGVGSAAVLLLLLPLLG